MSIATILDPIKKQADDFAKEKIPAPVPAIFRGVGQVMFQDNAFTGLCFLLGVAIGSPLIALGGLIGAAIGFGTANALKFDQSEVFAGIHGFNPTLVGMAAFFFFQPSAIVVVLLLVFCLISVGVTYLMRRYVFFPTYTTPFVVTTWVMHAVGSAMGAASVQAGEPVVAGLFGATAHGISQVMFQASIWTALLYLIGIVVSDWRHATWVVVGSFIGALIAGYHAMEVARAVDPEQLVERALTENVALGLYGYNATLVAIALYLSRRSLIAPLLGIIISVPVTEFFPLTGLPALTAPFVISTWIVLALGWLESRFSSVAAV